jgi:uncharacterized protein
MTASPRAGALLAIAAAALAGALFGALVPVRHRVVLEASPDNPVQHLVLESRSLLGLHRPAWGARVDAGPARAWGDAGDGFFLAPPGPVLATVSAWPGFRARLALAPRGGPGGPALAEEGDRGAFCRWFVAILEEQAQAGPSPAWEPAQRDCAGLLRFAFREAWGPHSEAWRDRVGFSGPPPAGDPAPGSGGPWRRAFPTPDGWAPFARGACLRTLACVPLGREVALARPGDLLFFSRAGARAQPDHAMAFVRPDPDGEPMLLYHTGPEHTGGTRREGELRRVRLDDLLHHPEPDFRPLAENPAFLGVYRWKVLEGRN